MLTHNYTSTIHHLTGRQDVFFGKKNLENCLWSINIVLNKCDKKHKFYNKRTGLGNQQDSDVTD